MRIATVFLTLALTASLTLGQQSVPPPPRPVADSGPSLEVTLKFIQDKVNQQGAIVYVESWNNPVSGTSSTARESSVETHVVSVDPAGGLSLQQAFKSLTTTPNDLTQTATGTWQMQFKDVEKLEVLNAMDFKHRRSPQMVFQNDPPYFEVLVHLMPGKTVQHHTVKVESGKNGKTTESNDNIGEFVLHFRDEETANRVAKAMIHAVELCGGGSKPEPF
ncbi:MAG: hypothetical protein ACLPXT_06915 [Terracidiphilus sp.]